MSQLDDRKLLLLERAKEHFLSTGEFPNHGHLGKQGFPRRTIRRYFGTLEDLAVAVMASIDEPLFTEERSSQLKANIKKSKVFFLTTAVVGAKVHPEAYKAVKSFCKHRNAIDLYIPAADHAANVSDGLDSLITNDNIVIETVDLNTNLAVYALKLSAKQISPMTGLGRIGQRNKSFIFASPKQDLEYVSVGNNRIPHALMTTGAITLPAYGTNRYMSQRTAFIAEHDHFPGGIIVEVVNDKLFHFRQVEFMTDGSFSDLGIKYLPNGKTQKTKILGMVLGDWHCGATCPVVKEITYKMIQEFKPEKLVLHDLFNGESVNHHVEFKSISKAKLNPIAIKDEIERVRIDLTKFTSLVKEVAVVKSNHDVWLDRYLEDGAFVKDYKNYRYSLDLAAAMFDGEDPLRFALRDLERVRFLKRDEDYIIGHTQCGSHGDIEGSLDRLEKSFYDVIAGHSHTPAKKRRVRKVGTSTKLREPYAVGPISWLNTHAIINEDGSVQLINMMEGKYKL